MKFEHTQTMGWEGAIRGMRNPMNSWDKSDSEFGIFDLNGGIEDYKIANEWAKKELDNNVDADSIEYTEALEEYAMWLIENGLIEKKEDSDRAIIAFLGPNDLGLAVKLVKGGPEHRKFMRQIFVSVDIIAPTYWWKDFDTYKVGTTANSTSTMHKLASTPISPECFELDDYNAEIEEYMLKFTCDNLERLRQKYNETKDKRYWKALVRWLPMGWLYRRTVTMTYENIYAIIHQRKNHKLNEWSGADNNALDNFIKWARTLPYADYLLFLDEKECTSYSLRNEISPAKIFYLLNNKKVIPYDATNPLKKMTNELEKDFLNSLTAKDYPTPYFQTCTYLQ